MKENSEVSPLKYVIIACCIVVILVLVAIAGLFYYYSKKDEEIIRTEFWKYEYYIEIGNLSEDEDSSYEFFVPVAFNYYGSVSLIASLLTSASTNTDYIISNCIYGSCLKINTLGNVSLSAIREGEGDDFNDIEYTIYNVSLLAEKNQTINRDIHWIYYNSSTFDQEIEVSIRFKLHNDFIETNPDGKILHTNGDTMEIKMEGKLTKKGWNKIILTKRVGFFI